MSQYDDLPDHSSDFPTEPALCVAEERPKRGRPRKEKEPFVGARVYYWRGRDGNLQPQVAILQRPGKIDSGRWDMTVFGHNYKRPSNKNAVRFSEEPCESCWSWMPNGVV